MKGMDGFSHNCAGVKQSKTEFQKSIHQSLFSKEQISIIWDFYVTRSLSGSSEQPLSMEDYGWNATRSKTDGYPAIEKQLSAVANIDTFAIIRAKSISGTVTALGLSNDRICIDHPRAVLAQKFEYQHDENEKVIVVSKESRIHSIFRHMRNSFAHGLTYFFDNGYLLLEDKDGKKLSASILIAQSTLLEWIAVIDVHGKYYQI